MWGTALIRVTEVTRYMVYSQVHNSGHIFVYFLKLSTFYDIMLWPSNFQPLLRHLLGHDTSYRMQILFQY